MNPTRRPANRLKQAAAYCWLLLPVLVFGLAGAAAAFGASLLRTVPQGSEEALASGIFFKESL